MRIFVIGFVLLSLSMLVAFVGLWHGITGAITTPITRDASEERHVLVPEGLGAPELFALLVREGTAASGLTGELYVRYLHRRGEAVPGEYALSSSMSLVDQLAKVQRGEVLLHSVSIPRGATTADIAQIFADARLQDAEALATVASDPTFSRTQVDADRLEGYLFPDVYSVPRGLPPQEVLRRMVARFRAQVPDQVFEHPRQLGWSPHQVLGAASIVEVAGFSAAEQRILAGLIYNRVRSGRPLWSGTNPLTRPAFDPSKSPQRQEASQRSAARPGVSRVEGRRRGGGSSRASRSVPIDLAPIANPGLPAIVAAANPADTGALYFAPRGDGTHVFCPDTDCLAAARSEWSTTRPPIPRRLELREPEE